MYNLILIDAINKTFFKNAYMESVTSFSNSLSHLFFLRIEVVGLWRKVMERVINHGDLISVYSIIYLLPKREKIVTRV